LRGPSPRGALWREIKRVLAEVVWEANPFADAPVVAIHAANGFASHAQSAD
jgi:hypothetical protein